MVFEIKNYDNLKTAVEEFCAFLSAQNIPSEKVFDSRLVAHELLANVLQHASGGARLLAEIEEECIRIIVKADEVFQPPKEGRCPDVFSERGRGLFLIDRISDGREFSDGEILVKIRITK